MAGPKRRRGARPRKPDPGALRPKQNKAKDLLPDDGLAEVMGWVGQGYRPPEGPPWPWDGLLPDERALFDRAVARLVLVRVPRRAALAICWAEGDWHRVSTMIASAADVQAFPDRHHIRLVPRPQQPSVWDLLGLPPPRRPS